MDTHIGKYQSENTIRKILIGITNWKRQSKNTKRENTNRETQDVQYNSENDLEYTNREMQVEKIQLW